MYCPKCANEVKPELNYCNSCGYRIDGGSKTDSDSIAKSLTKALGWIGVVGFASFVFVMIALLESQVPEEILVVISLLYLAALFGICYLALRFIKSLQAGSEDKRETQFQSPREIQARNTNQLEPARTPPASVTEQTTRTLEKVPVDSEK